MIEKLDGRQLRKFSFRKDTLPTFEAEFWTVTRLLERLPSLRVLHLVMWLKKCKDLDPFVRVFHKLRNLEEVELCLSDKKLSLDHVIGTLVQYSPAIKHISMIGMKMTDDSLISLSRLHHLSFLEFWPDKEEFITTTGVLTLLRGGSRLVLRFCCLCWNERLDMRLINEEISLMETETGRTLDRQQDKINCIHFSCN